MPSTPYQASTQVAQPDSYWVAFPVPDATVLGNADFVLDFVPGHSFLVVGSQLVVDKVTTGAGGALTITPKVDGTAVSGCVIGTTLAGTATLGTVIAGSAPTTPTPGSPTSKIRLTGSGSTAYTAGAFTIYLRIQNLGNV